MKVNEVTQAINEIERLRKDDYTGGKGELDMYQTPGEKKLVPLPGGSGLFYSIRADRDGTRQFIFIVDPKAIPTKPVRGRWEFDDEFKEKLQAWEKNKNKVRPTIVAKLSLEDFSSPIPNAVQVGSITVDEDYRGMGLAKALYGIVLSVMKKTLVAGSEQTPGGRRNWMSLANIPGVEVKGFVQIDTDDVEFNPNDWPDLPAYQQAKKKQEKSIDAVHDNIMRLGGQFIGKNKYAEYWAFDVVPGNGELAPAVKTTLNRLYSDGGYEQTGLYARWVGR
jgi:GNAT superfamily N-acetyltransferase